MFTEGTVSNVENREQQEKVEHLTQILFDTFKYSQGDESVQRYFFSWIADRYPELAFTHRVSKQVSDQITEIAGRMVQHGAHVETNGIAYAAKKMVEEFERNFSHENERLTYNPLSIFRMMIERDLRYMKGMGKDKGKIRKHSHVIAMLKGDIQPRSAECRALFVELREEVSALREDFTPDMNDVLVDLEQTYNGLHQNPVTIDALFEDLKK